MVIESKMMGKYGTCTENIKAGALSLWRFALANSKPWISTVGAVPQHPISYQEHGGLRSTKALELHLLDKDTTGKVQRQSEMQHIYKPVLRRRFLPYAYTLTVWHWAKTAMVRSLEPLCLSANMQPESRRGVASSNPILRIWKLQFEWHQPVSLLQRFAMR